MYSACPHCSQRVIQDANSAGKFVECPKCSQRFQLPLLSATFRNVVPLWMIALTVVLALVAFFFV